MSFPRWRRFLAESSFLREYCWKYRRFIALGLLSLVVVDLLEVVPPMLLKEAVDSITAGKAASVLAKLAGIYLAVALVQSVCRYGWRMYLIRTSVLAARDLRNRYSSHLFSLSSSFFDKRRVGDLMTLATTDVEAVRMMLGMGILTLADSAFYFVVVPIAMYSLSPQLMLLAFLPLPIIPWLVMRNERQIHLRFARLQECLGRISAFAQEGFSGIRVVKAFAGEEIQLDRFRELIKEYRKLSLSLARVQTAFGPTLDFTMSLGLASLLFFGGRKLIDAGGGGANTALTLGIFVAFQRYIQQMVWPMAAIGLALTFYQRSRTSTNRIEEVLSVCSDVSDPPTPLLPPPLKSGAATKTSGRIEFRNLHFRFPDSTADVLRGVTLEIKAGERLAFVGAVGAGKSALLSLLPRLYPVGRGMLLIDGIDVNDWPVAELRRQVGYVSQDVFLFSETVVENVAFGVQDWVERSGGTAAIHEAAELAAVHEEVVGLAQSYETRLGERGVNLSGGQKQRLTIARALAKSPSILVLDDALSSVDVQTEERILRSLRERRERNTEIITAHRISTIRDADRIAVLANGAIAQIGTHAELIAQPAGLYWKFYEQQRLREDLERYLESTSMDGDARMMNPAR